jgi:hypothetical protein
VHRAVVDIANDTVNLAEDAATQNLNLLANDSFENSGRSITAVTQGSNGGTVTINNNGTPASLPTISSSTLRAPITTASRPSPTR